MRFPVLHNSTIEATIPDHGAMHQTLVNFLSKNNRLYGIASAR